MSDRPCNYCHLQSLRHQAVTKGLVLETRVDSFGMPGLAPEGVSVYMRKANEVLDTDKSGKHFVVWFMSVSPECTC